MIHVIATISVKAGRRNDFLNEFRQIVPLVLAEDGCIDYGPATDLDAGLGGQPAPRNDVVTVIEKWENVPALEAHLAAPHMLSYKERVKDILVGVEIRVLQPE